MSSSGQDAVVQQETVASGVCLRRVLVTGGTGSFGHAFLTYALAQGVQEVRVLSRDEFKQEVMRKELHDPRVKFYLGDVRDRDSVDTRWRVLITSSMQQPSRKFPRVSSSPSRPS